MERHTVDSNFKLKINVKLYPDDQLPTDRPSVPTPPPAPGSQTIKDGSGATLTGTGITVGADGTPEVTSGCTGDMTITVPARVNVLGSDTVILTQNPKDPTAPSIKGRPGSTTVTGNIGNIFEPFIPVIMLVKNQRGTTTETIELKVRIVVHFVDVQSSAYFNESVYWAVRNRITKGTTRTTFSPSNTCTQAHIITFLWRSNGSPKANVDVPIPGLNKNAYYYPAVQWAYQKKIIDQNFGPQKPCTRAIAVKYMYINAGSPAVTYNGKFTDMGHTGYESAVQWALNQGVTKGRTDTTFAPYMTCTRAQIVTFLWRGLNSTGNGLG